MDDLRWILLLAGAAVVAAIYFSSRFENEDWTRERKQLAKNKAGRTNKKSRRKKVSPKSTAAVAHSVVKKEPSMGLVPPVAEKPAVSELVIEVPAQDEKIESEISEPKTVPDKVSAPLAKDKPRDDVDSIQSVAKLTNELPIEEPIAPGIEDEITEVEIPVDLAVAEAEIHVADTTEGETPKQAEMCTDIEPLVLSVIVLADDEEVFSGPEIKEAMEMEGLHHGAMSIFHQYDPDKPDATETDDAVFSVANVLEPGSFDLDKLDEIETPGLMLFCQLPGPLSGEAALELMLDKGRGLAVRLHGHMCDDKRNRFTAQAKNHYLDRISNFSRELALARSKTTVS